MSCLPSRCRCEERLLAPFISHYNRHTGTAFEFRERLDVGSHIPQPEALYVDLTSQRRLVVERKNLIWPPDYARIHDSLHTVTSIVDTAITPHLIAGKPYKFIMHDTIRGSVRELRRHAERIGKAIVWYLGAVHAGKTVWSCAVGREWSFRMEGAHERDWNEPSDGIRFVFERSRRQLRWGEVPDGLVREFARLLESTRRKFLNHADATRVLVIDFHGDLRHPDTFIEQIFAMVRIPSNVDEIWMSIYALVTELHYGWIHQQLWPKLSRPVSLLSGETVVRWVDPPSTTHHQPSTR